MANDRVYQLPAEVLVQPDNQKAQIYQEPVEVIMAPTSQKARVYQVVVEVLWPSSNGTTPIAAARAWGCIIA